MKFKNLFLWIFVLSFGILSGCSMYCAERFYGVSSGDEAAGQLTPALSSDDAGIKDITVDDLIIHVSSENYSTKGYSLGPWLLAIIPMPPNESNTEENIKLRISVENIGQDARLDLANLKLILPNGKEFYPFNFFYGTEYPQKESGSLWLIKNKYQEALIIFDITKKGILSFGVDLNNIFIDKRPGNLSIIHFEEKIRKYMDLLP